jgi:hypothetical protein
VRSAPPSAVTSSPPVPACGRRDDDGEHRVDLAAGGEHLERRGQLVGAGDRAEVDRVGGLGRAGQRAQAHPHRLGSSGTSRPGLAAGVGGEGGERVRRADDGDPPAGGQRLVGEQLRRLEQLRQRGHAHDACGGEQRADGDVALPAAALERDDRLGAADLAGDAGELAGVAEAAQVEHDHLGALVGAPVLQQVVAGDVGAVADRHERRQPERAPGGLLQERARRAPRTATARRRCPAAASRRRRSRAAARPGRC